MRLVFSRVLMFGTRTFWLDPKALIHRPLMLADAIIAGSSELKLSDFSEQAAFLKPIQPTDLATAQYALKQLSLQMRKISALPTRALGAIVDAEYLAQAQTRIDQLNVLLCVNDHASDVRALAFLDLTLAVEAMQQPALNEQKIDAAMLALAIVTGLPKYASLDDLVATAADLHAHFLGIFNQSSKNKNARVQRGKRASRQLQSVAAPALSDVEIARNKARIDELLVQLKNRTFAEACALFEGVQPNKSWESKGYWNTVQRFWPHFAAGLNPALVFPDFMAVELPKDWPMPVVQSYLLLAGALKRAGHTLLSDTQQALMLSNLALRLGKAKAPAQLAISAALLPLALSKKAPGLDVFAYVDTVLGFAGASSLRDAAPITIGLAAAHFPAFNAWLLDSVPLDRYLSLQRALGLPIALSNRLLADFNAQANPHDRHTGVQLNATLRTQRRLLAGCDVFEAQWRLLKVDEVLRCELSRALKLPIGALIGAWNPDWRDAARLYFNESVNQDALRTLLLTSARSAESAQALRTELPANKDWLLRAEKHMRIASWLNPPELCFEVAGKSYTLHAERDPLQALRLGVPFDTCLSIEDGCNRFAAVPNALDANKWVWYLRGVKNQILARKLVAVSEDFRLLGYRFYSSSSDVAALREKIDAHILRFAQSCGIAASTQGAPSCLNGPSWYDDGAEAFFVSEFALQIGELPAPLHEHPALLEFCQRWLMPVPERDQDCDADWLGAAQIDQRLHAGDLSLLPNYMANTFAEQYLFDTLAQRHGDAALAQVYRRRQNEFDYWALMRSEGLGLTAYWREVRAQKNWSHSSRFKLPENAPDALAALKFILRDLQALKGNSQLEDDGLEHHALVFFPQLLGLVDFSDALLHLPRIVQCLTRLLPRMQGCEQCFADCYSRINQALCWHWLAATPQLRLRQRRKILQLVNSARGNDSLAGVLICLLANITLDVSASVESQLQQADKKTDRAVLSALAAVSDSFPAIAEIDAKKSVFSLAELMAATLRHTATADFDANALIFPEAPPFAALDEVISDFPALWPLLRRYAPAPGSDASLNSFALLFWLSKVQLGWHDQLVQSVLAMDAAAVKSAEMLAQVRTDSQRAAIREQLKFSAIRAERSVQLWRDIDRNLRKSSPKNAAKPASWLTHKSRAELILQAEAPLSTGMLAQLKHDLQEGGARSGIADWRLYRAVLAHPNCAHLANLAEPKVLLNCPFDDYQTLLEAERADWLAYWIPRQLSNMVIGASSMIWMQRLAQFACQHAPVESWLSAYFNCQDYLSRAVFLAGLSAELAASIDVEALPKRIKIDEPSATARFWLKAKVAMLRDVRQDQYEH